MDSRTCANDGQVGACPRQQRDFDILVFGATGFTGGMVSEHLVRHARPGVRLALAGRSWTRLQAVRERLVKIDPRAADIGLLVANIEVPRSLLRVALQTRVLLNTVGPFVDYGAPVVEACIEAGTDYIDSTGEHPFVRAVIERYGEAAERAGVRLINACGFDSIPADLGVLFTVLQLPEGGPVDVRGCMSFRGWFSGGTERSAIKTLADPGPRGHLATDSNGRSVRAGRARLRRLASTGAWLTPFETVDAAIVLRTAAALRRYGPRFCYTHYLVHRSLVGALVGMCVGAVATWMARIAPVRELLLKLVKPSGVGPTPEQMDAAWFCLRIEGQSGDDQVVVEVSGGDPGYRETSMMLGQSALCLIEDRAALQPCAGVLTPARALGLSLLARLQRNGMRFEVVEGVHAERAPDSLPTPIEVVAMGDERGVAQ